MQKRSIIIALSTAATLGAAAFLFWTGKTSKPGVIDPSDQMMVARGKEIYSVYCAACHGQKLEGQANWRQRLPNGRLPAPPHDETGHTWHHPDTVLIDIVKNGLVPGKTAPAGYESDMPAYASVLSDKDIVAVIAYIKSRWPAQALKAQEEVTQQAGN